MIKFAVISFPGTNCEDESVRAIRRNGMEAEIVLWNDPGLIDGSRCSEFDGYFIPGGWSYEDRGRSGVVAAQDPVMKMIIKEADFGKVVLGICNGAQILVETGLIPGFDGHPLASALAWNEMWVGQKMVDSGFFSAWSYLKNSAPRGRTAFNDFDELQHVPFAHGEGRYMMNSETLKKLEDNHQVVFRYCDSGGKVSPDFPITPNGAMSAIAGLCNPAGNVMALMPHPERDPLGGNSNLIFQSIKKWIEKGKRTDYKPLGAYPVNEDVRKLEVPDVEIFVRLIITDNTERTIEETLIRGGYQMHLDRYDYYGIKLKKGVSADDAVRQIMGTGELANFNKHLVFVRTKQGLFSYTPTDGMKASQRKFSHLLIAADRKDFVGLGKQSAINAHAGSITESLQYGVMWDVSGADEKMVERIIESKVLYNPHSMYLMRA